MKCYMHPKVDSVDTCTMCKKPMCEECKLDYDGKIVCKPCAMPLMNLFAPMIYGGCNSGPTDGDNITCMEYLPGGSRPIKILESTVKDRITKANLTSREDDIRKYILKCMAKDGKPPSTARIMKGLSISSASDVERTIVKLHNADILCIKDGRIISAYPFSVARTSHRVIFDDGHEVFALCAIDALGIHSMLNQDTTIISSCTECNQEIKIVIRGGRIILSNPESVVVYVNGGSGCGRVSDTCCPHINFFCSKDELYQWMWLNPEFENGEVYSLDDALEYGKKIFGNMLR